MANNMIPYIFTSQNLCLHYYANTVVISSWSRQKEHHSSFHQLQEVCEPFLELVTLLHKQDYKRKTFCKHISKNSSNKMYKDEQKMANHFNNSRKFLLFKIQCKVMIYFIKLLLVLLPKIKVRYSIDYLNILLVCHAIKYLFIYKTFEIL